MKFAGMTHQFLGDVLPSDFRAEIFSLVEAAFRLPLAARPFGPAQFSPAF
jgi:hypothetical protein